MLQSQSLQKSTQSLPQNDQEPTTPLQTSAFKELNGAIMFSAHYNEILFNTQFNPSLVSTNMLNPAIIDDSGDKLKSTINKFGGLNAVESNDNQRSTTVAKEITKQTNSALRFIDLMEIAEDDRMNAPRPAIVFSNKITPKQSNNISLVRSQYLAKDLAPIDEIVSFGNSLDDGRINDTRELENELNATYDKYSYTIQDKKYTNRKWQEKFHIQPEIPVKVVKFYRNGSQSPLRETQRQCSSPTSPNKSPTKRLRVETAKDVWGDPDGDSSTHSTQVDSANSPNKSLPYFQYSFKVKKDFNGRCKSPTASTRDINFKELIDNEILNVSKNKSSSSRNLNASGTLYSSSNTSPAKSPGDLLSSTMPASSSFRKAIIVDAGKRFRLPRSPH